MKCEARQFSDRMHCELCQLDWDTNDSNPPRCAEFEKQKRMAYAMGFLARCLLIVAVSLVVAIVWHVFAD